MDRKTKISDFINRQEPYGSLFEYLDDVIFFIKDLEGRFVTVNNNFLKRFGYSKKEDVIGLTDYDMISLELAQDYERDDKKVTSTGVPIIDQNEQVSSTSGLTSFFTTTKLPVYNNDQQIIGLVGIVRDIAKAEAQVKPVNELQPAIDYIEGHFTKDTCVNDLADLCSMSVSTFLRRFKKKFSTPPVKYIRDVRLKAVSKKLLESKSSLCDISFDCGFCDQSYMTREFKKMTGLTPKEYRLQYA